MVEKIVHPGTVEGSADLTGVAHWHVQGLRLALFRCAEVFREYEALHEAKGTPEAHEKALRNAGMAIMCEAVLKITEGSQALDQQTVEHRSRDEHPTTSGRREG